MWGLDDTVTMIYQIDNNGFYEFVYPGYEVSWSTGDTIFFTSCDSTVIIDFSFGQSYFRTK